MSRNLIPSVAAISSAEEVDRVVAEVLAPRKPPLPLNAIGDAWKAIVADGRRRPVKVIFDTDIGTDVDDVIALAFGLRRPELDIRAVTTSRGEVGQRAAIVSRLLKVMGRADIPFAPGSPVMFNGLVMRDKPVNQFPFAGPEEDRPRAACDDAQQLLIETIKANWGEIWLVAVGPLTNAAILLRDHPEVAAGLKGIAIMGGEPATGYLETNIKNDPEAAAFISASGLLKFIGTFAVTVRILVPQSDHERLRRADTPLTRALTELIGYWRVSRGEKPGGPVIFDMCPLVWLFAPELFTTVPMGVKVETAPAERRGAMIFDAGAPPCAVTTDVDAVAVHRLLMDSVAH